MFSYRNKSLKFSCFSVSSKQHNFFFNFTGDLGASAILGNLDYSKYLGKLLSYLDPVVPDAFRSEFVRCWHAKSDGSAASTFHRKCDGKGPTVPIIKYGSYIFGGFTDLSWQSKYLCDSFMNRSRLRSPRPLPDVLVIVVSFPSQPEHFRYHSFSDDEFSLNTNITS